MKKNIICLSAPGNSGKTKTIRSLFLKLGGDKNMLVGTNDFVADLVYKQKKIAFVSQGDPNSSQLPDLEKKAQEHPDIIVSASRTKGSTVKNINTVGKKYGYTVVRISPFYFYNSNYGTADLFQMFAEQNADNIAAYIDNQLI